MASKRTLFYAFFSICYFLANAQVIELDSLEDDRLPEMVISASRQPELKTDIPNEVDVLGKKRIEAADPLTTADALEESGSVFVQRSQQGGGSPVVRGFEANRVLLVMDGVRMNNAIYRSGHLQNSITTDPSMMQRIEVLHGAGSVIYGTDAIGGVVSFFTRSPQLSFSEKTEVTARAYGRFASANNGTTWHADVNVGKENFASLTGVTLSQFGDLRMGKNDHPDYPEFGLRTWTAERINGRDSILVNPNPRTQKGSSYDQMDLQQKLLWTKGAPHRHEVNVQFSTTSNVPRYDRLAQLRNGKPRNAEWNYGPQTRLFAAYSWIFSEKKPFFDGFRITPAFQKIQESRITRGYEDLEREINTEDLWIASANGDFFKNIKGHEIRYGVELVHNNLKSTGLAQNIETRAEKAITSRYPSGTYSTAGIYFSHRWELWDKRFILSDGLRLSGVWIDAKFGENLFGIDDLQDINQQSTSLNWNLGGVLALPYDFRLNAMLSTGFRNPNLDDLGKTFELNDGNVTVPNTDASAEQVFYQEMGLSKGFGTGNYLSATGFVSHLQDALVRRPFLLNGKDSLLLDGTMRQVFSIVNIGQARVWGLSFDGKLHLYKDWTFRGSLTYTKGRDLTEDVPLDHIPPLFGHVSVQFSKKKWETEARLAFNGWKRIEDYSPNGSDNPDYATAEGTPAWQTINVRGAYRLSERWKLQVSLENILDRNYRNFASGINAAGRNLVASVFWTP